ncbi:hypothetical protein SDC9_85891 [bioreactor metagenome]|uniref:Uncharacterized protein n=1 Tax=bioreactor metagenome TaxID=1076179 RepID=A0A644ZG17_9ZZZZ
MSVYTDVNFVHIEGMTVPNLELGRCQLMRLESIALANTNLE